MSEWLFEIRSGEIPARMQVAAKDQLKRLAIEALSERQLESGLISCEVTPRRLVLLVEGLPPHQPDLIEEKRGPRTDAPQQAIQGFLDSTGLTLEQCERRTTPKGDFYFATRKIEGRKTEEVLPEIALYILTKFQWPKSMRWGDRSETWVRPLDGFLSVYNGHVVPFEYAGLQATGTTRGHRFLSSGDIAVTNFLDYQSKLRSNHVILNWDERRAFIKSEVERLAHTKGFNVLNDEGLLDEVAGLVEWPVALMGTIDQQFMDLPREVLTTPMRVHQRYFPLLEVDGKRLASGFVVIANTTTADNGALIVKGNERVLRARLSDARFFWDQDLKQPLSAFAAGLDKLLFHGNLGTLADKTARLEKLASWLAKKTGENVPDAMAAASLCKADLTTGMVGEFPELQGIMGRYYGTAQGLTDVQAQAIEEHYWPKGAGAETPTSMTSILLGIADRLDTLVGFFAVGIQPTGSKDPFALRRAAVGLLSLVGSAPKPIPLKEAISYAYGLYDWKALEPKELVSSENTTHALWQFFLDRFKFYLKDQQESPHDHVEAVLAIAHEQPDFKMLSRRVKALDAFLTTDNGTQLLAASKRASNILKIEERNDRTTYEGDVKEQLLSVPAEVALFEAIRVRQPQMETALSRDDFDDVMSNLAELRPQVDAFFDQVTVNDNDRDVRQNRLQLLSLIRQTLNQVADFSKIEG